MWQRYNITSHIFELSSNNGASWAPMPLSAAAITEGVFAPARIPVLTSGYLPANVAYRDIDNNFVAQRLAAATQFVGPTAHLYLSNPADAVGEKHWRIITHTGQAAIKFELLNDGLTTVLATPLTLNKTGVVTLNHGQLEFPSAATPSSSANTLDCYAEGAFTPTIGGSGGQSGQTYSYNTGVWNKVGNRVFVQGAIAMSALGTITGSVRIAGLPYSSSASLGRAILNVGYFTGSAILIGSMSGYVPQSSSYIELTYLPPAGGTGISTLAQASLTAAFTIIFSCSYIAGS